MIILSIVILFWLGFGYFCFSNACTRRKSRISERNDFCGGGELPEAAKTEVRASRRWIDDSEYEPIYINSKDGYRLFGKLIEHREGAKGIVIFAHGYHSSCRRDLAVQIRAAYEDGYNVLLIVQRSHGLSEGRYICFGAKERYDILLWSEYISERFSGMPIALFGLSMGAATVMMASELPLPENVRCIIADCGFTSPKEIIANTLRTRKHIIVYPTIFFMNMWSILLARYSYWEVSTVDTLKKNTRPLLLIHGELDTYVPTEMSYRNREAGAQIKELYVVPNAKHAQAVYFDTAGYLKKELGFLNEHMK